MTLKQQVFESLDQAVTNGYDLSLIPAVDIAADLHEYNTAFEDVPVSVLLPHVTEWVCNKKE